MCVCVVRRQLVDRCAPIIIRYLLKVKLWAGIMRSGSAQTRAQNFPLIISQQSKQRTLAHYVVVTSYCSFVKIWTVINCSKPLIICKYNALPSYRACAVSLLCIYVRVIVTVSGTSQSYKHWVPSWHLTSTKLQTLEQFAITSQINRRKALPIL